MLSCECVFYYIAIFLYLPTFSKICEILTRECQDSKRFLTTFEGGRRFPKTSKDFQKMPKDALNLECQCLDELILFCGYMDLRSGPNNVLFDVGANVTEMNPGMKHNLVFSLIVIKNPRNCGYS